MTKDRKYPRQTTVTVSDADIPCFRNLPSPKPLEDETLRAHVEKEVLKALSEKDHLPWPNSE